MLDADMGYLHRFCIFLPFWAILAVLAVLGCFGRFRLYLVLWDILAACLPKMQQKH